MKVSVSMDIAAPIEVIYDAYVLDEHIAEWSEHFIENKYETEEDRNRIVLGATYTSVQEVLGEFVESEAEIVELEPKRKITVKVAYKQWDMWTGFSVEQKDAATVRATLTRTYDNHPVWAQIASLFTRWLFLRMMKQEMKRLKEYVEQQHSAYKEDEPKGESNCEAENHG